MSSHQNFLCKGFGNNACTLVPTVFLRHGKTEFELPVWFFVYPRHRKTEFFVFWKWNSNFYFRFATTLDDRFKLSFPLFVYRFCTILKIGIRTCIFVFRVMSLSYFTWTGRMLALPVANNRLARNHALNGNLLYVKAGIHKKAVFWLGIMFLMQISHLRFKQSRISMLISRIYVLGRFVNFLVIFRYIWR